MDDESETTDEREAVPALEAWRVEPIAALGGEPIDGPMPLQRFAEAHDRVDADARGRILLTIPQES